MNVNADALSRNPVITQHVNIVTRRQALERNTSRERGVEENNQNMKSTSQKTSNLTDQRKTTKRKCKKKINYAESDIESDIEAATKVPERSPTFKNYQTSPTNDEPSCKLANLLCVRRGRTNSNFI